MLFLVFCIIVSIFPKLVLFQLVKSLLIKRSFTNIFTIYIIKTLPPSNNVFTFLISNYILWNLKGTGRFFFSFFALFSNEKNWGVIGTTCCQGEERSLWKPHSPINIIYGFIQFFFDMNRTFSSIRPSKRRARTLHPRSTIYRFP